MSDEHIHIHIGEISSFVGAHFWNYQFASHFISANEDDTPELARSCTQLYRTKHQAGAAVYTPRAVFINHSDSAQFKSTAVKSTKELPTWDGRTEIVDRDIDEEEPTELYPTWTSAMEHGSVVRAPSDTLSLPQEVMRNRFDHYYASSTVDHNYIENYYDHIRRLTEECDYLRCISITADIFDGFAGVAASLAEEIRLELPSVNMPIWTINSPDASFSSPYQFNIPLAYTSLLQNASLLIPVSLPTAPRSVSTSQIATAIEIITGTARHTKEAWRSLEWEHVASAGGQFPIVEVETLNRSCEVWNSFSVPPQEAINPFMTSLSSVRHGEYSADRKGVVKPFSNLICTRGTSPDDFGLNLFRNTDLDWYSVSHILQRDDTLKLHRSFHRQEANSEVVFSASGVGCGIQTGQHVEKLADALKHLDASSLSVLDRVGVMKEDVSDSVESLLTTSAKYEN